MKPWRFKYGGEFEKVRLMALSMDNVGLKRSLRTYASRIKNANYEKEVAHLLRHQRSKNDPGGEKSLAPSHLYIASSIGAIYARCPLHVCSKLHNLEISRDHDWRFHCSHTRRESLGAQVWNWPPKCCEKESADREVCPKEFLTFVTLISLFFEAP
jgi:hypothetical protein